MSTLYRLVISSVLEWFVLSWLVSHSRRQKAKKLWDRPPENPDKKHLLWFHAASVGELETLWPIIVSIAEQGAAGEKSRRPGFVLTVFSESAEARLNTLKLKLEEMGTEVFASGYSPWEGQWKQAFLKIRPLVFVTAKYEAWPELWMALSELSLPLIIVSARQRRSLSVSKMVCKLMGVALPKMTLLTVDSSHQKPLELSFPSASVQSVGEPRWDQVFQRLESGSSRAKELLTLMKAAPRPWGVLAQVWPQDLEVWRGVFKTGIHRSAGTLFIVPHKVDEQSLKPIENFLRVSSMTWQRSSSLRLTNLASRDIQISTLVVDEMGFLSELYSGVDWVYVGGGFGDGVHSTIEPAVHGIPLCCGPNGSEKFTEIAQLESRGQLRLVRTPFDVQQWIQSVSDQSESLMAKRDRWKQSALQEKGATTRICQIILGMLP